MGNSSKKLELPAFAFTKLDCSLDILRFADDSGADFCDDAGLACPSNVALCGENGD